MNGITITENRMLCQPGFVRWRRVHRRPRIQKKWRRFGAVHDISACPHVVAKIKEATT